MADIYPPHPFPKRTPATFALNDRVNKEIDCVLQKLKREHGIDDVQFGMEVEIKIPNFPANPTHPDGVNKCGQWEKDKSTILMQRHEKTQRDTVVDSDLPDEELLQLLMSRQMENFRCIEEDVTTPAETLAYSVRHALPDVLIDDGIFHDAHSKKETGESILEFRFNHCSTHEMQQNLNTVYEKISETARSYGYTDQEIEFWDPQMSISFWDKDGNILANYHDFYQDKGLNITEGIARATFDAAPFIYDFDEVEHFAAQNFDVKRQDGHLYAQIDADNTRESLFRCQPAFFDDSRIEFRNEMTCEDEHTALKQLMLMQGALYGLEYDKKYQNLADSRGEKLIHVDDDHYIKPGYDVSMSASARENNSNTSTVEKLIEDSRDALSLNAVLEDKSLWSDLCDARLKAYENYKQESQHAAPEKQVVAAASQRSSMVESPVNDIGA